MATRDILVLNTTASRAETQQGSDTVVVRGNSREALSVENSSGTSILSVNTVSSSVDVAGKITTTTGVSSSLSSTGSFGRLEATTLVGSAFNLRHTEILGTISSSGQIANQISGSFRRGFEFTGTIGDTIPDQENKITASFGRIVATSLSGSAANLTNTQKNNTISSSAQIASQISGAFTSGFEFDGTISGSANSTGSFARIDAITLAGDGTELTNIAIANTISSSAQLASKISGSFTSGFKYSGTISGSATSTGSFTNVEATTLIGDISNMSNLIKAGIISSSAQLATSISGSFNKGFSFSGEISGSGTSTGSFTSITATNAIGNISAMSNIVPTNVISSSAQLASKISGSFNKGFEFTGTIKRGSGTWSAGGALPAGKGGGVGAGQQNAALEAFGSPGGWPAPSINAGVNMTETYEYNGSSWSDASADVNVGRVYLSGGGTQNAAIGMGGNTPVYGSGNEVTCTEEYDGSSWSNATAAPRARYTHGSLGTQNSFMVVGHQNAPLSSTSDEYNGTNWTAGGDTPHADRNWGGAGTVNAGSVTGGRIGPAPYHLLYDGTTWSEGGPGIANNYYDPGHSGTQNDSVRYGGYINGNPYAGQTCTYLWDGSTWSNDTPLIVGAADFQGSTGQAPNGSADTIAIGGASASPMFGTCTQHWTMEFVTGSFGRVEATSIHGDISNMTNTAKAGFLSSSAQIASNISGSFKGGISTTGGHIGYGGVWSVGTAATDGGGNGLSLTTNAMFGNNNAAGVVTGCRSTAPWTGTYTYFAHYQYNGTNWSQSPHHLNYSRAGSLVVGQQEAAFRWGGGSPGSHLASECYNGSSWTQQPEMVWHNSAIGNGFGESSNAAAQFGGAVPTYYCEHKELGISYARRNCFHQEWDGTSWFVMPGNKVEINLGGYGSSGGSVNSAFFYTTPHQMCAHKNSPKQFETWDGVSWKQETKVPPKLLNFPIGFGTANDAVIAGGTYIPYYPFAINPNSQEDTYAWDGVSWKIDGAKMNQPRQGGDAVSNIGGGIGTSNALAGGGGMHPAYGTYCNQTEHYDRGNGIPTTGSFFEVTASSAFSADLTLASGISFPIGTLTGSAQIASRVSGSFNQRYVFDGNFGGGGGTWYATGLRNTKAACYGVGGGTVNAGWLAGGTHGTTSEHYWEKFDGMSWTEAGGQMLKPRCGVKGGGSQNAGVAFGGNHGSPSVNHSVCTEEMNGITWSEVNNLSTGKGLQQGGWGEQTAALSIGGDSSPSAVTEQWDGLNWSNQVSTPYPITQYYDGIGTVNAGGQFVGTACGPAPASPNYYWNEWNGSTWSEGNKNISPKEHFAMFGKADSAVIYGGNNANTGGGAALVEEYDGTGWSLLSCIIRKNRYNTGHGIGGSSAAGIAAGGQWNGGNWTVYKGLPMTSTGYPAARYMNLSFGFERNLTCVINTHTASIADEPFMQNRYTVSASIDSEHHNECSRIGNVTADTLQMKNNTDIQVEESMQMPIFYSNPPVTSSAGEVWYNATEEKLYFTYDINSWSEVADTNSSHAVGGYGGGIGDGIVWAGGGGSPTYNAYSEVWNGISWSEVNDLNQSGVYVPGAGSSNAAIAAGRNTPGFQSCTELWDGTSWTEANDGAIGYGASFAGTVNAGFQAGCRNPGNSQPDDATKEWNGTNWYAGGDQISAKADQAAMLGTQNAAKHMGGGGGAYDAPLYLTDLVEDYNGTSFSTATSLPVGTHYSSGGGTQNAGIMAGGLSANSPHTTATYEWNGVSFHQTANLANGRRTNDIADGSQSSFQVSGGGPFANTTCVKTEQYTTTGIGCHCIGGV